MTFMNSTLFFNGLFANRNPSSLCPTADLALSPLPSSAIAVAENPFSNSPASVLSLVVHRPGNPQRDERNTLAELLHDYLQMNPEPIIGSPDNPFPFADDLGITGVSILSAFIEHADMETFTCIFCGDIQTDIDVALVHQRIFLESCVDVRLIRLFHSPPFFSRTIPPATAWRSNRATKSNNALSHPH